MLVHEPDDDDDIQVVAVNDSSGLERFVEAIADTEDPFETGAQEYDGLQTNVKRKLTRKLNKEFKGQAGTGSKQQQTESFTPGISAYNFFDVIEPPYNLEYLAKLYEVSAAHAAAVRAKVIAIVGLGYRFKETDSTKFELRELYDKPRELQRARKQLLETRTGLFRWLESTNEEDSFTEVLRKVWTDVETTGNGYLEIGRKLTKEIGYIGHVPSHTMRVRRKRDGFVQIQGQNVTFFRNFGKYNDPNPLTNDPSPNEVIHFKKYTPTNSYYGLPDIIPAMNAIGGNEFASKYNNDYFENAAVPRHLIVVKNGKLSPEAEQNLLNFFHANLKGQHHRTLYIPVNASGQSDIDFQFVPVENKLQDASFIRFFQRNDDQIFMAHRVPRSLVETSQNIALAAARDATKNFKEQVARPEQDMIENKLRPIFEQKTDALKFRLEEMTLTDEDTMSKIWERRLKTQAATPNEERAARGEMGIPGGDEVLPVYEAKGPEARETRQELRGRERDSVRSAEASDSDGEGRNEQGAGRRAP